MKNNKKTSKPRKRIEMKMDCFFCKDKKNPTFIDSGNLIKFTSERGKIYPRSRTGLCSSHQKKLTTQVKIARYMALLPFVVRPE